MTSSNAAEPERLLTGVSGLDAITFGGLVAGGIYVVVGRPGAGKSILGNQLACAHAKRNGRAVYVTLLAETHARLLAQMRRLAFFQESLVGKGVVYFNAMATLETERLDGLLRSVQSMVREQEADLVILDGLVSPQQMGVEELAYKKFIAMLQSWVGVVGCTVVVLKTGSAEPQLSAEQTMVDGILLLHSERQGMRTLRQLEFTKLRGTAFAEGRHAYVIGADGLVVYPRAEATFTVDESKTQPHGEIVSSGTPGLDPLLGGGLIRGSTTLYLGSSGAGKSIAALQFLVDGARAGEPVLYFGFFEPPHALVAKADRLGLGIRELAERGLFHFSWKSPAEPTLDQVAHDLLALARANKVKRIVIDGFAALRTADYPERISAAFSVITNELSRNGITTVVTDETRELFVREVYVQTQHVSGLFHNIVFLRQVEIGAQLRRLLGVMKTRDSGHDQRLWELTIDETGLRVRHPFAASEHGLMGGDGDGPGRRNGPDAES